MNEGGASGEWKSAPSAPKLRAEEEETLKVFVLG